MQLLFKFWKKNGHFALTLMQALKVRLRGNVRCSYIRLIGKLVMDFLLVIIIGLFR